MLNIKSVLNFQKNKHLLFISTSYLAMLVWWILIFKRNLVDTKENYIFGLLIGVLALLGGVIGIIKSRKWGFLKSVVGKSICFLALGLMTWGVGTVIFAYYNLFLNIAVPYPSIADVAYIVSWPLWTIGMIYLAQAIGVKYQLKKVGGKIFLIFIPLIIIPFSYFLLFTIARGGSIDFSGGALKLFFDLTYPIGDIVILTTATLIYSLSIHYLGGVFRFPILIIMFGFLMNFFADFAFSFTTTNGTFYVADWVDLLFTTTMFILSLGVSLFDPSLLEENKNS